MRIRTSSGPILIDFGMGPGCFLFYGVFAAWNLCDTTYEVTADERSRTSTPRGAQAPEACASANSATSAWSLFSDIPKNNAPSRTNISDLRHFVKNFSLPEAGNLSLSAAGPIKSLWRCKIGESPCSGRIRQRFCEIWINSHRQMSEI